MVQVKHCGWKRLLALTMRPIIGQSQPPQMMAVSVSNVVTAMVGGADIVYPTSGTLILTIGTLMLGTLIDMSGAAGRVGGFGRGRRRELAVSERCRRSGGT